MRLTLYANGIIRLSAPEKASLQEIQSFLDSKSAWLRKKLAIREKCRPGPEHFVQPAASLFLWGAEYPLAIHEHATSAEIKRNGKRIEIFTPDASSELKIHIERFYAQETAIRATPLLDFWTRRMNLASINCSIRHMKSRWGSCTPKLRRIRINAWLAAYVPQCLEYVLVHELCHFFEGNHGPGFYKILAHYLPDWASRREILRRGNKEK